jgi:hypothetical protein
MSKRKLIKILLEELKTLQKRFITQFTKCSACYDDKCDNIGVGDVVGLGKCKAVTCKGCGKPTMEPNYAFESPRCWPCFINSCHLGWQVPDNTCHRAYDLSNSGHP